MFKNNGEKAVERLLEQKRLQAETEYVRAKNKKRQAKESRATNSGERVICTCQCALNGPQGSR